MTTVRYVPLDHATWPAHRRCEEKSCPFRAGISRTLSELEKEARMLGAGEVLVEVDLLPHEFRLDGRPYASATHRTPRVRVSFQGKKTGAVRISACKFKRWDENLRAIVKTMEALRASKRYGVVSDADVYRGFSALPPGGSIASAADQDFPNAEAAARWMVNLAGDAGRGISPAAVIADPEIRTRIYRAAAKNAHPDHGGKPETMAQLGRAKELVQIAGGA